MKSLRDTIFYKAIHYVYVVSGIREYVPRKVTDVNGVQTRKHRLVEFYNDNYENESVEALIKYCKPSDSVLILGGGFGVTTVHAARIANNVVVYEAARSQYNIISNTIKREEVQDSVDLRYGLVSESCDVYDNDVGQYISPADLPACDVWEVDIEGGELALLKDLPYYPRVLIIECHPKYNTPAEKIISILEDHEYTIQRGEHDGSTETLIGLK
jgi:hypothetical protein